VSAPARSAAELAQRLEAQLDKPGTFNAALLPDEARALIAFLRAAEAMAAGLEALLADRGGCVVPEKPCASLGIPRANRMCGGCHAAHALSAWERAGLGTE